MLVCMGAGAQVTEISDKGLYSIQFCRTYKDEILKVKSDLTHNKINETNTTTAAVFQFEADEESGVYYLKECSSGKYVYAYETTASTSASQTKIQLGNTTLPASDSETPKESLSRYKWVLSYVGSKGTYGTKLWTIKPKANMAVFWAVYGDSNANPVALYGSVTSGYDHYHFGFVQILNPTLGACIEAGYTASGITSAGYTLDQVAEYYKPTTLDKAGWPTTAAYNTFKTAINALADDAVVKTAYVSPYQTMCSTYTNPTIGAFYRIKDKDGKYLYATEAGQQLAIAATLTNPMSSVFYTANSASSLRFISFLNGYYIYTDYSGSNPVKLNTSVDSYTSYSLDHGASLSIANFPAGSLRFKHSYNSGNYYWYSYNGANIYSSPNQTENNTRGFYFEEVTSLPVTITTAQYATLYSPVALTIPSGVKAYTGKVVGSNLSLTEVSTTIPANTAVVLKADPEIAVNKTFYFPTTTSAAFSGENDLEGTTAAKAKTEGDLVLGNGTHGIGFYGLTGTTLAGFKAYLPAAKVSDARELRIVFADSETTGIESLTPTLSEGEGAQTIYDLQGRKVQKPSRGLYIINGKKVVIK